MYNCESDLSEPPAANVVIDGREAGPSNASSSEERAGLEIDSIVRQAYEEHEDFIYKRGIAELARRAIIIAKTYPPYMNNMHTLPGKYGDDLDYLKHLLPEEDLEWLDYFPF